MRTAAVLLLFAGAFLAWQQVSRLSGQISNLSELRRQGLFAGAVSYQLDRGHQADRTYIADDLVMRQLLQLASEAPGQLVPLEAPRERLRRPPPDGRLDCGNAVEA